MTSIGFLQFHVQFGDPAANMATIRSMLADAGPLDLLVLPELAFSGYEFTDAAEVATMAEEFGRGAVSDFLQEMSARTGGVIVAGYAESSGGKLYNSAIMASAGRLLGNYRKIHLFSRENDLFSPGDAPPAVIETPVGRVGMMICFDWFFPEVARSLALQGAQVIAHPSNLVLPWCQRAMFARSVENHVFTITANRIGSESRAGRELVFTGGSQVLGVDGGVLAQAGADDSRLEVAQVDLAMADQKQINPYNNLLSSRRPELYGAAAVERE